MFAMAGSRAETFAVPDRGLQVRMVLATVVSVAIMVTIAVASVLWGATGHSRWIEPAGLALAAVLVAIEMRRNRPRLLAGDDAPVRRCRALLGRLCVVADVAAPAVVVTEDRAALSWTVHPPRRAATVYVTQGLLARVDDEQLAAVLAHELSHIANRDAGFMTVIAGPPTGAVRAWWRAVRAMANDRRDALGFLLSPVTFFVVFATWPIVIACIPAVLVARLVSRYRELCADRGAALLTGSAAGVADAVMAVSHTLAAAPGQDLRRAAYVSQMLHFVPARDPAGIRRLWATHPTARRRVDALQALEARVQSRGLA